MSVQKGIDAFLAGASHAVVGASANRAKYGNMVLRAFLNNVRAVYPINPRAQVIEGVRCYPDLASLARDKAVHGVSVITPPKITEQIVLDAADAGIMHIWMQPGAESPEAIEHAEALGMNVIAGGPCVLVVMGFSRSREVQP